jgi:hypothetical protein
MPFHFLFVENNDSWINGINYWINADSFLSFSVYPKYIENCWKISCRHFSESKFICVVKKIFYLWNLSMRKLKKSINYRFNGCLSCNSIQLIKLTWNKCSFVINRLIAGMKILQILRSKFERVLIWKSKEFVFKIIKKYLKIVYRQILKTLV